MFKNNGIGIDKRATTYSAHRNDTSRMWQVLRAALWWAVECVIIAVSAVGVW